MRSFSLACSVLVVACVIASIGALQLDLNRITMKQIDPSTLLDCMIFNCNHSSTLTSLSPSSVQDLKLREIPSPQIPTNLLLGPAESTTTTTVTTPFVTSTMSSLLPSFTVSEGTTYHYSTTIPWVPISSDTTGTSNYDPAISVITAPTIVSNGTPVATITPSESSFHVNPPPSITSASSLVTFSNASTTTIIPASSLSDLMNGPITGNSTTSSNDISGAPRSTVTSTSLTTVDVTTSSQMHTSTASTHSTSAAATQSDTDAPLQSSGNNSKGDVSGLVVAFVIAVAMGTLLPYFI